MRRRLGLASLWVLALFALPLAVAAQSARVYRIGVVLQGGPYASAVDGLREGLREQGLEEGKQFVFHVRDTRVIRARWRRPPGASKRSRST